MEDVGTFLTVKLDYIQSVFRWLTGGIEDPKEAVIEQVSLNNPYKEKGIEYPPRQDSSPDYHPGIVRDDENINPNPDDCIEFPKMEDSDLTELLKYGLDGKHGRFMQEDKDQVMTDLDNRLANPTEKYHFL